MIPNGWQVSPQYDFAFSFNEGLGIVFLDGKPSYIDKNGHKPFNTDYVRDLMPFVSGRAFCRTYSGKMGLLNQQGQLIVDTIFNKIYPFDSGGKSFKNIGKPQIYRAATVGLRYKKEDKSKVDYAIIDTNGRFLVNFGQFSNISDYENGFATATNDQYTALFDASGKEVFRLANDAKRRFKLPIPIIAKHGVFKVLFPDSTSETAYKNRDALMNFKGEFVLNDTAYTYILDYDDKKAVAYNPKADKTELYFYKPADKMDCPELEHFPNLSVLKKNGVDIVQIYAFEKRKYGILDSCFNWQVPPQYFWTIELPTYSGCIKTKCRCLVFTEKEGEKPIISSEWEAGINPAQFWKSPMYDPSRQFGTISDLYEKEE